MYRCEQSPQGIISDKPLTEQQTRILAKGLNYNTKDAAKLDYVADLESTLKNTEIPDETKQHIRHQIATNLNNKRPVKLDKTEQKAIKDLQNDNEIIILPADKGRMTVIMNKSDYIDKANTLLNDTETYQPLDTDPNKTTVNRINQKLKQLKDKDKLSETIPTTEFDQTMQPRLNFMDYLKYIKKTFL